MMKIDVRLILLLLLLAGAQSAAWPVHTAKPGGIAVIAVSQGENPPAVLFDATRALLIYQESTWYAVVGIPLSHPVGTASISVSENGLPDRSIDFEIVSYAYRQQHLQVNRNYVEPDAATLERIFSERKIIDAALNHWEDTAVESLTLAAPVAGQRSTSFGSRRFFNNQPRSPHSGMDIAANLGTTVIAPLDGVVEWWSPPAITFLMAIRCSSIMARDLSQCTATWIASMSRKETALTGVRRWVLWARPGG